jgi:hypothetical protein
MTILWEFDEKHPKQVSAYGTQSWATSSNFQPSLRDWSRYAVRADLFSATTVRIGIFRDTALFSDWLRSSPDLVPELPSCFLRWLAWAVR